MMMLGVPAFKTGKLHMYPEVVGEKNKINLKTTTPTKQTKQLTQQTVNITQFHESC